MKSLLLILILLMAIILYGHARLIDEKTEKFDKLRLTPKGADTMKNLHKNCYYTAIKAIIGKLGSIIYKELPKSEKRLLARCLDKIEDRRELITSAKCVVTARKRLLKLKSEMSQNYQKLTTPKLTIQNHGWKAFLQQFDDFDRLNSFSSSQITPSNLTFTKKQQQSGFFKESESSRRFSPRKLKKVNRDYSFMQISTSDDKNGNPAQIESSSSKAMSFKQENQSSNQPAKFKDIGSFKTTVSEENQKSVKVSSTKYSKMRDRILQKKFKKFQVLSKKLEVKDAVMPKKKPSKLKIEQLKNDQKVPSRKIRRTRSLRFPDSKDHYYKEAKYKVVTKNEFNGLSQRKSSDNPIISSITNVIREFTSENNLEEDKGNEHLKWTKTYNRLMKVRQAIDEQKRVPGAKVYEHRMYDLVLDKEEPSLTPSERHSTTGIMHDSMKLLQKLTSSSSTNDSAPYYRALSPRFMPLMPLNDGKNVPETLLSPTILAMYDEPKKSNELSIGSVPGMLQSLGVSKIDRDKILQVVMDLSGSKTHIDEALKIYETLGMFDEDIAEPLLNATERIMGAFQKLESSLFPQQKLMFENRGFAFLKKHQMEKLMRDHGHTEDEIDLADFDIYDKMSDEEMEISLWKTIENIANNKTDVLRPSEAVKRRKRDMIYFLQPTILSPFMFTIQKGVSIAGPLILSPTAFAPPILNPAVASPWILSPGVFDPFVLSPYIFCPFVLGPLAFTPFILTPYFLSPNVLNPYIMSSLILSPIGLSPDILSPQAIGATVLSPSILSPAILTPTVYTASVLSPTFLS